MTDLINKWTSMITLTSSSMTGLLAAIGLLALGVAVVMIIVAGDDVKRAAHVGTIVKVLLALGVFAVAGSLVTWAMS